jgi:molybdopterin-dependent oxidoreductase-like protein
MSLWDLENADCEVVMGSNMAENHPVAFRFLVAAQRRGATIINVDPRFIRTSALADIHAPIRSDAPATPADNEPPWLAGVRSCKHYRAAPESGSPDDVVSLFHPLAAAKWRTDWIRLLYEN